MIIYQLGDIHLGSKMASLKEEVASKRRALIFSTFSKVVKEANNEGVKIILLPGDIFDEDTPSETDLTNFYQLIYMNPNITFYYLRGNHDLFNHQYDLANIKYFSSSFKIYKEGDINIGGLELSKDNISSFYEEISFPTEGYNILMLHGDISKEIDIKKLKDKNIDYLALGHIHTYLEGNIDKRGRYAYSGVFLGRGYDETGEKGYIKLDTKNGHIEFVNSSKEIILEDELDISSTTSSFEVAELIKNKYKNKDIILRLNLNGETKFPLPSEGIKKYLEDLLGDYYLSLSIKEHTEPYIDIDSLKETKSFEGEFIRNVLSDNELSQEDKYHIISIGIKAMKEDK